MIAPSRTSSSPSRRSHSRPSGRPSTANLQDSTVRSQDRAKAHKPPGAPEARSPGSGSVAAASSALAGAESGRKSRAFGAAPLRGRIHGPANGHITTFVQPMGTMSCQMSGGRAIPSPPFHIGNVVVFSRMKLCCTSAIDVGSHPRQSRAKQSKV